jgi:quercetin dioxygenase-like cupin family protein
MTEHALADLLSTLRTGLAARSGEIPELAAFAEALAGVPARPDRPLGDGTPPARLRRLLRRREDGGDPLRRALARAAPLLSWRALYEGGGIDPRLAEGLVAAQAVGPVGRIASADLSVGALAFAPRLHYPLHAHPAAEVYVCVAGRITLGHGLDGARTELRRGGLFAMPAHRPHLLETGAAPALLIYIWRGALNGPTWWWSARPGGGWQRTAWTRAPGEPWRPQRTEPVSPDTLAEALAG